MARKIGPIEGPGWQAWYEDPDEYQVIATYYGCTPVGIPDPQVQEWYPPTIVNTTWSPPGLTEDDVRRVVREELADFFDDDEPAEPLDDEVHPQNDVAGAD